MRNKNISKTSNDPLKPWQNGTPNSSQVKKIKTCIGGWPNGTFKPVGKKTIQFSDYDHAVNYNN